MALRKQLSRNIFSDDQQTEENTQEDESADDGDSGKEFTSLLLAKSPARERRRNERANKPKEEMTEEEMMDLALRLSEKEASDVAFQQEQEKEAVMKAIQESMVGQTQPCLNSPSKTDRSHRLSCRRRLSYREGLSAVDPGAPVDGCTAENDLKSETKGPGDENVSKKRKRSAGSPELEVPPSFQSQDSPCSLESLPAPLHSPQSSDSTQIDDAHLQKSPVFALTGRNVALHIDRLKQELVDTCRSSGFVLCSQDSLTISEKSAQPRSPTFPRSNPTSFPKSPFFSKMVQGEDGETEPSPEFSSKGASPSACGLPNWETAVFGFSSQDSLTPSVTSFCPKSPVFPRSPNPPNAPLLLEGLSASRSNGRRRRRWNDEPPMSPVFGKTPSVTNVQEKSLNPSAAGCNREEELHHWQMKDPKPDGSPRPSRSEELNLKAQMSAESEPPSQMALVWSDEDEQDEADQTFLVSPVFPEERAAPQAEHRTASQNHKAAGSPGEPGPDSSQETGKRDLELHKRTLPSTSTSRLQISITEEELSPTSRQEAAGNTPPPEESLNQPTIHYYWGVPFCPQGLDPDRYTQVIVAQMEVYEKSLKQTQRVLLRKAEWGEGIQPQSEKSPSPDAPTPSPQPQVPPRGLRRRGRKRNDAVEEEENEEKNDGDEEQMETDDCDVCPETQLSDDGTQDLIVVTDGAEETHAELQEGEAIPQEGSPIRDDLGEDEEDGGEEMGVATCTKTKENISGCSSWTLRDEKEVKGDRRDMEETKDRGIQRSASPELESAVVPRSPTASVDCPICQASFPASEIEMHAAYCDGEVAVVGERRVGGGRFQEVATLRRRKRRAGKTAEETIRNLEKCYICQKVVPLSDYSQHTELCCLRPTSRTPAKGNLLSALKQTEKRDSVAGPSGSKLQPQAVIDLREDDDDDDEEEEEEEEEAAEFRIRDSPIRFYTSISEATGCLIDFKKQQRSKKPSQKRR
ncbi:BRCA1-A complex subunit RAP80 isoform X3 [Nothobranchius furzeri]|uniref:BRCA1-A complex subunit RAP80 isoform X3 n=1 Tax=Nothobranchius furzeri TaxID=105023 RepID=UPI003904B153